MTLAEIARRLTAESLNGGGWTNRTRAAHTSNTTPDTGADNLAGRRRMRELAAAWGEADEAAEGDETEAS